MSRMSKLVTGVALGTSGGTILNGVLTKLSPDEWSAIGVLAGTRRQSAACWRCSLVGVTTVRSDTRLMAGGSLCAGLPLPGMLQARHGLTGGRLEV